MTKCAHCNKTLERDSMLIAMKGQLYCSSECAFSAVNDPEEYKMFAEEVNGDILEDAAPMYWHDLRKNPTDLPQVPGNYLVCIQYADGTYRHYQVLSYYQGWNCGKLTDGSINRVHEITDVSAWHEIKPLE